MQENDWRIKESTLFHLIIIFVLFIFIWLPNECEDWWNVGVKLIEEKSLIAIDSDFIVLEKLSRFKKSSVQNDGVFILVFNFGKVRTVEAGVIKNKVQNGGVT